MCDIEQPVHQLALLLTLFMVCEVACADFRHLYNNSNVRGPGGGIPRVRRALRTRPVGNVPSIFDDDSVPPRLRRRNRGRGATCRKCTRGGRIGTPDSSPRS